MLRRNPDKRVIGDHNTHEYEILGEFMDGDTYIRALRDIHADPELIRRAAHVALDHHINFMLVQGTLFDDEDHRHQTAS